MPKTFVVSRQHFDAVIFDLDGVITQSAKVHAKAWKAVFDAFLEKKGVEELFSIEKDYPAYVDGKPRYDGVRSFLESRGINLPFGSVQDPPDRETVCGLGNAKNQLFRSFLKKEGIEVYRSSVELARKLRKLGFKLAIVSSSKNCSEILESAGIHNVFDVQVDGLKAEKLGLHGKPAPDIFLEASKELNVSFERTIVIEDAIAGVQAGAKGHFGLVIGVDRANQSKQLHVQGADLVVEDLAELEVKE